MEVLVPLIDRVYRYVALLLLSWHKDSRSWPIVPILTCLFLFHRTKEQPVCHSQQPYSQETQTTPHTAGNCPLPTANGYFFSRRATDLYHFPYHIIYRTFFLCHNRTVTLYQQTFSFTTDDAMKYMLSPVAEQYHIHRL